MTTLPLVVFSIRTFPQTFFFGGDGISQIFRSGSSAEEILSVRLEAKLRKPALEKDECVIS
jgi:hypothetical protein